MHVSNLERAVNLYNRLNDLKDLRRVLNGNTALKVDISYGQRSYTTNEVIPKYIVASALIDVCDKEIAGVTEEMQRLGLELET